MEKEKGFTIIEMIVVVALVVILPSIVVANFPQIKLQFSLSRVAYGFSQNARRAQDLSLSSVQYIDINQQSQPIAGYGIYLDDSYYGNKAYVLYADAWPGNQHYDEFDYIVDAIDFSGDEKGVIIKEMRNVFGNSASINFTPPNPSTTITELDENYNTIEVIFSLESDGSKTKTVSINTSGLVEIK